MRNRLLDRGKRIESEFIEQLDAYYASPSSGFYDAKLERRFYEQKLRHLGWKPYPNDGLVTFGASGTDKCDAEVFFRNQQVKPQKSDDIPFRGRQRSAGTAIVDFRQLDLLHMPKRLGDKAKFTLAETETGEINFEDAAQKREVFEYNGVKFAITAKPDGILDYEGGQLIFEFKTKASGLRAMNGKLDWKGAEESHIRQVIAETLVFGIRECIILYESTQKPSWFSDENNRNVTKGQKTWVDGKPMPDMRPFYIYVTDEMQDALLRDLAQQAAIVYNREKPWITAEMTNKCGFCPYFGGHCHAELTDENLVELREIEARFAKSSLAGKYEHRNLANYLAEVKGAV